MLKWWRGRSGDPEAAKQVLSASDAAWMMSLVPDLSHPTDVHSCPVCSWPFDLGVIACRVRILYDAWGSGHHRDHDSRLVARILAVQRETGAGHGGSLLWTRADKILRGASTG